MCLVHLSAAFRTDGRDLFHVDDIIVLLFSAFDGFEVASHVCLPEAAFLAGAYIVFNASS